MRNGGRAAYSPPPPRVVSPAEIAATVDAIAAVQEACGRIDWFPGHHWDPWNMVEAAMALDVGGRHADAKRVYEYLASRQRPDGWWHAYYEGDDIKDSTLDANAACYIAVGTWHHLLATEDWPFFDRMWRVVEPAIDAVLDLQLPGGEVAWSREPQPGGKAWSKGLIASSSCIHLSLRCAIAAAEVLGMERPDWELSAGSLAHAVAHRPHAFENKDRWSMDWYYPVLCGVLTGDEAADRIESRWNEFVVPGLGVRCVSDQDWITAAETCELVLALDAVGQTDRAREVFSWVHHLRDETSGAYWTGVTFPDREWFPQEQSTWTSAAVVLASDALTRSTRTSGVFRGEGLPVGVEVPEHVAGRLTDG